MADAQQTLMDALMGRANIPNMLLRQRGTMMPPTTPPGQLPQFPPPPLPGYQEWQAQGPAMTMAGGEPYMPTPQINDIQQLFGNSIMSNAPTSNPMGGKFLRDITLGGHLAGGNEI